MYYIFIKDNKTDGCGQCRQLTEDVINFEVDEEFFNTFKENPEKYIYKDGEIVFDEENQAYLAGLYDEKINELKQQLADTDYIVVKIAEAESDIQKAELREQYAQILQNRVSWRMVINELERQKGA